MNKYNTKLGQLLALVDRSRFDFCVKETDADKGCKGFTAWQQFVSLAFAQLAKPNGLRSLESSLNTETGSLYHIGLPNGVRRSTIAYANANRTFTMWEKLFYEQLGTINRHGRKKFRKDFYAIDATEIVLNINDFPWAEFRRDTSGVKINLRYDINNGCPDFLFITNAKEHENNTLKKMELKKGDTAAFDMGYNNYAQFGKFCDDGVQFVTRLKINAKYRVKERRVTKSGNITSDQTIVFTGKGTGKKCPHELRRIRVIDEKTGNAIVILTNIFDRSAEYIAKLYRARWNIEIFFKAIKQNLKIERFFGQSENAVKTQIWIALIVYLLFLKLREQCTNVSKKNFTCFMSEIKVCLFQRASLIEWFMDILPKPTGKRHNTPAQYELPL